MENQPAFSADIGKLTEALIKVQASLSPVKEESSNPFFKSKYADLASVWKSCKEPLSKNGLAVFQTIENAGEQAYLVTTLAHVSGQWMRSYMPIIMTKHDPQSFGSAVTYCRRYALSAIVGAYTGDEDDDAETAMEPTRGAYKSRAAEYINQTQVVEISGLLDGRPALKAKLFGWANVRAVEELPVTKYAGAMKAIVSHLEKEGVA
jgi:hypothetical protein